MVPEIFELRLRLPNLSHFGGVYLLHQFFQHLGLRTFLNYSISYPQRNNRYTLSELLIALMYPMILGLEKIEVSALLGTNGVFQYITGLPSFPNPTTLRRFLIRSAPEILPQLRAVHDDLRAHFICLPATPSSFWLDCDSTAHTLYGNQEGAVKGYNPGHPGKKSYHPLVITEAHGRDCSPASCGKTPIPQLGWLIFFIMSSIFFHIIIAYVSGPTPDSITAILWPI